MRSIRLLRTTALATVLAGTLPVPGFADDADVPTQIVDTFNQLFGKQTDLRANHAKGIVVEGSFRPAPPARS